MRATARAVGRRIHRRLVYPVLDFVWPSTCFGCGEILGPHQRFGACAGCWCALRVLGPPVCPGCGLPRPPGTDLLGPARDRCAVCLLDPPQPDGVRAAVRYDAVARSFLLRAKRGGRRELFEPLAAQLARVVEAGSFADGCTAVVAVPSHPWVDLRRGFSPGTELARHVARRLRMPFRRRLSRRLGAARSSRRLAPAARRRRARVEVRAFGSVAGERLLLVDDVMTTGASVEACTRALRQAGAAGVRVAVWARVI